jgi:dGTPase
VLDLDVADDIAYSTYDLEDSLHAGFVTPLSIVHALKYDDVIRDSVRRKVNASLQDEGYEPVDDDDLIYQAAILFSLQKPIDSAGADEEERQSVRTIESI